MGKRQGSKVFRGGGDKPKRGTKRSVRLAETQTDPVPGNSRNAGRPKVHATAKTRYARKNLERAKVRAEIALQKRVTEYARLTGNETLLIARDATGAVKFLDLTAEGKITFLDQIVGANNWAERCANFGGDANAAKKKRKVISEHQKYLVMLYFDICSQ